MKTDLLLDTNVLFYALDVNSPFHAQSRKLLLDQALNLFVMSKSISEYFAVCSKLKIPLATAMVFYRSLCKNATILYPSAKSLAVFEGLLLKYQPIGNRVFDFEIAAVGLASGVSEIATFNQKDFAPLTETSLFVF